MRRQEVKKSPISISYFVCPVCQNMIPLPRPRGNQRAKGHLKWIYCPYCRQKRNFIEHADNAPIRNMAGEEL